MKKSNFLIPILNFLITDFQEIKIQLERQNRAHTKFYCYDEKRL